MVEILKSEYRILHKIGQGGMAEIYSAIDRKTGNKVAIKILHPENKDSYTAKKRFKEEIQLTAKVDSPYVVRIYDWRWDDVIQYIVMEYIQGNTLKDYVQSKTRLTVDEAVDICKQLTLGFEAIHKAGIIHRDIKATNVVVTNHGQAKIIDFGIAITDESERYTKTDNIIASPQYLAPELVELEDASKASDIYSLGILLYEMLTGSLPYHNEDQYQLVLMHKNKVVPHVNKMFPNVPQALANVVIKATAKDKSKRYRSMYEFYKDVDTSLDNKRLYEPVLSLMKKKKMTFKDAVNSKWTLVGIVGVLVIILLSVITVLLIKGL